MAKVVIKSEKLTPFGGIFSIMELFNCMLGGTIDCVLGQRCLGGGYRYSEIIRSLMCVYFCGGSCIEDVMTHLMPHLSLHPTMRTGPSVCSPSVRLHAQRCSSTFSRLILRCPACNAGHAAWPSTVRRAGWR